jgi:hypothetical protein
VKIDCPNIIKRRTNINPLLRPPLPLPNNAARKRSQQQTHPKCASK